MAQVPRGAVVGAGRLRCVPSRRGPAHPGIPHDDDAAVGGLDRVPVHARADLDNVILTDRVDDRRLKVRCASAVEVLTIRAGQAPRVTDKRPPSRDLRL